MKPRNGTVIHFKIDANRIAANFAIFDIRLTTAGEIKQHRDFFPTVWAGEKVLFEHGWLGVEMEETLFAYRRT